jgi:hypothetical protein
MTINRKSTLPPEVMETVRKRIDELTEELRTKYDPGFRPGVFVLPAVDRDELPDGFWIVFPPTMPAEMAFDYMEAGYETMRKFIDSGIIERLKILHKYNQDHPRSSNSNSDQNEV